jgi:cobalt/nickel transport system permease protein
LRSAAAAAPIGGLAIRRVFIGLLAAAVVTGAALSWFASTHPDGLEWSLFKTAGTEEMAPPEQGIHASLADIQEKTAVLPNYAFKPATPESDAEGQPAWPAVDPGTSVSGVLGGALTLCAVLLLGLMLKRRKGLGE